MPREQERVLQKCHSLTTVIEVGMPSKYLVLFEVTRMNYIVLTLSLSMLAVAHALTLFIQDCID